jgi:hypothetical protein
MRRAKASYGVPVAANVVLHDPGQVTTTVSWFTPAIGPSVQLPGLGPGI